MTTPPGADDQGPWLAGGSPGSFGDPEVWLDAEGLGLRAGTVLQQEDDAYLVITRRHSHANSGRPYYVLRKIPDQPPWGSEEGR